MIVKKYMTPNPVTVTPEDDVRATFNLLFEHGFRQAPVVKDGKLVGIVTDRDLRTAIAHITPESHITVGDVMTSDPITVTEYTSIEKAARMICHHKFNALPVTSDMGELVGIITTIDILEGLLDVYV
jgi:acetoin utilization protein AcuB